MEVLKRYSLIALLGAACLFSSCEEEFEVKVEDTSPKIFLQGMVSPFLNSPVYAYKAVPVGVVRSDAQDFTVRDLSLKINGTEVGIVEEEGGKGWRSELDYNEGDELEFTISTRETGEATAVTTIPRMLGFSADSTLVEGNVIYTIQFDETLDEDSKFAVAVILADDEYLRVSSRPLSKPGEDETLLGALTPDFRLVSLPFGFGYKAFEGVLFNGKELGKEKTLSLSVPYYEPEDSSQKLKLLVYTLSEELYGYLNAEYNKNNNVLSMLGLAPSNFAYSNVDGGYGVLGGYSLRIWTK